MVIESQDIVELKEDLESGFEIDLKSIDNLDDSGSSFLRENPLENDDIENTFTKLLSKDLLNSANNSFNYKDYIESEEFENIYEKISDTKAAVNHQEIFEKMKTRSRSLNKDNIILKPTTPLRRTTSVQNKRPQK